MNIKSNDQNHLNMNYGSNGQLIKGTQLWTIMQRVKFSIKCELKSTRVLRKIDPIMLK